MNTPMKYPQRRSPRLKGYDYSQPGYYFITICVHHKKNTFGAINEGQMHLNEAGKIAQAQWEQLQTRFSGLKLDVSVIMPNHLHGIIVLTDSFSSIQRSSSCTLGDVVRDFKVHASFYIHKAGIKDFHWQQKYWDVIIRNERQLTAIRKYITNNPAKWELDQLYHS